MDAREAPRRTPASRRLLAAALFAGLVLLTGCKAELFGKVDEADANAALNILYGEGIVASKSSVGDDLWRVEVDEKDHQRALQVTHNQGIPRERFVSMGELFKKEGLVSTPSEIRMRYIFAVSQELSNTLSQIDGVVSARVHPVMPLNDPLAEKVQPASAAVFIKHLPDADLRQMAPAIKTLITRSIEGLKVDNVSLTFFAARASVPVAAPVEPQQAGLLTGLLGSDPVVSSLAVLLAGGLAMTWGVMGWRVWRQQQAEDAVALAPVAQRRPAAAGRESRPVKGTSPARFEAPLSPMGASPVRAVRPAAFARPVTAHPADAARGAPSFRPAEAELTQDTDAARAVQALRPANVLLPAGLVPASQATHQAQGSAFASRPAATAR